MKKNFLIRNARSSYAEICDFLMERMGFIDIARKDTDRSIKSKSALLKDLLGDTWFVFKNIKKIRNADILFCVGYSAIPVMLLAKLKIIRCRKLYWFSFFLHAQRWFPLFRIILTALQAPYQHFIVFSEHEMELYAGKLNIPRSKIIYVPYSTGPVDNLQVSEGDYCFAGGYSNRDYGMLIQAFRNLDERLVICASKHNDLPPDLPGNVQILYDLPLQGFIELIAGAKICILPLNANSGASGQSVTLKYMQFGKPIIVTRDPVIAGYLNQNNSVLIEPGDSQGLVQAINTLINNKEMRRRLGGQASEDYFMNFQSSHFKEKILNVLLRMEE